MICPNCTSSKIRVLDKRATENNTAIRRRRLCLKCKDRFTTYERIKPELIVIKRGGKKEKYNLEKIKVGMVKSLEGRPVSEKKFAKVLEKIDNEIRGMGCTQLKSKIIGEIIIRELKKLDRVAYVRFMSFYKKYDNIKSFKKELGR
jgi:transcriptional repressor NrdR